MKIEILVNGIFPINLPEWMLRDCIYRFRQKLSREFKAQGHQVIFRWHTWDQFSYLKDFVNGDPFYTNLQPIVDYMPYSWHPEEIDAPRYFSDVEKFKSPQVTPIMQRALRERVLQILGTAMLIEARGDKPPPDAYVRVRWDAVLDWNFDFSDLLRKVKQGYVVGFQQNVGGRGSLDLPMKVREQFEKGQHQIERTDNVNQFWYQRVMDYMIFFKPEAFDPALVWHHHNNGTLKAAEWGWWQILCKPTGTEHINYNGLVTICRVLTGDAHDASTRWKANK